MEKPQGYRTNPALPGSWCYALGKVDERNKLYFGDNLRILRDYVADASVDLIYLDPPFNSSATYSFSVAPLYERRLFSEKSGEESAAWVFVSSPALHQTCRGHRTES